MAKSGLKAKEIKEEALAEVLKEKKEINIRRFKDLFSRREKAKEVLRNIEREIEDLELEIEGNNQPDN